MSATVSPSPSQNALRQVFSHDIRRRRYEWLAVGAAGLVALASIIYPVVRMFYNLQIDSNEGWNVYSAFNVTHHIPLYGQRYSLTAVNYPALSFHFISWLHRLGFGYLMTGRALSLLSLLASALFVGLIVWRLSGNRRAAAFASFFCIAVFSNAATSYVGMDDPQMLAQSFFLAGFLVYVSGPPGWRRLGATSLLFIVGGNIKHNLVGFPLAVLVDLFFVSRRKAGEYLAISAVLLGASIAGSMWADGPYFVSNILLPRTYSLFFAATQFVLSAYAPLQILLLIAAVWTIQAFRDARIRVVPILFWLTLLIGVAFGGGAGVGVNAYFDLFLSASMIAGLFLHWFWKSNFPGLNLNVAWNAIVPLVLLSSLAPSWFALSHRTAIQALPVKQQQFQAGISFLASRPGTAVCESLLLCYEAGKQDEYNPFSSFMLIEAGDLGERPLIDKVKKGAIGAVEFSASVDRYIPEGSSHHFTPAFAAAVASRYTLAFQEPNFYIYVPKPPGPP